MATRVFSDEELARLRSFPQITPDELIRYFPLMPADVAFVDPGHGRGPADRLGRTASPKLWPARGVVPLI